MNDTTHKLANAYHKMLERMHHLLENEGHSLLDALFQAKEKAVELSELSREEADKIAGYLQKDAENAAHYLVKTEHELSDWLQFDIQLIEANLQTWLASVADKTVVELNALRNHADLNSTFHTGDITGPGTLTCQHCGATAQRQKAGPVPVCAECEGTLFHKNPASRNT